MRHSVVVVFYTCGDCNWFKDVARCDVTGFSVMAAQCVIRFSHQGAQVHFIEIKCAEIINCLMLIPCSNHISVSPVLIFCDYKFSYWCVVCF